MMEVRHESHLLAAALGPNYPDDGDEGRQRRGLAISALTKVEQNRLGYKAPSQSGKGDYIVALGDEPFCTCPDFETRKAKCEHVYAVEYTIKRETGSGGSRKVTETVQVTQTSEWTVYNQAQTHEAERFSELLQALCEGILNPPQATGRPRLPMSDVVYSLASRAYSTMSGRRHATELREAEANGVIAKAPSCNSAFRYLETPELTPLLKSLIEETANGLADVEDDFAVDSSGFSTRTYNRWFDHKWGKERSQHAWVKTHVMCGIKIHVVTAVEAFLEQLADTKQLPYLLERTARTFDINEVSGDKAYSDHRNLRTIDAAGAVPYIPFKSSSTGQASSKHKYDGLWHRMWAYYNFNRADFNAHYHKRSNVETVFSMIKAKFGGAVRAKSPVAQVNEFLCKILCRADSEHLRVESRAGVLEFWGKRAGCPKTIQSCRVLRHGSTGGKEPGVRDGNGKGGR